MAVQKKKILKTLKHKTHRKSPNKQTIMKEKYPGEVSGVRALEEASQKVTITVSSFLQPNRTGGTLIVAGTLAFHHHTLKSNGR